MGKFLQLAVQEGKALEEKMAPQEGLEPPTLRLTAGRSTVELLRTSSPAGARLCSAKGWLLSRLGRPIRQLEKPLPGKGENLAEAQRTRLWAAYALGVAEVPVDRRWTVAEVLAAFPQAARVFNRHGMGCVGCDMAGFDTLATVAATYGIPWEVFAAELWDCISAKAEPSSSPTA